MAESLTKELEIIGLTLNANKTQILRCNSTINDESIDFVELNGEFVKILEENDSHRYLGKTNSTSAPNRHIIEIKNRKQVLWVTFGNYISFLLNRNVSLQLRLKYFDVCIGPALLFGTSVLPISKAQLQEFDRLHRKMLRRIVD